MYGLRQSPPNFYRHLRQGLESRGFTKSDHDNCIFTDGDIIILFLVDDALFYYKHERMIDNLILDLKEYFLPEKELNVAGFIGLKIDWSVEGRVVLPQTGLIE